MRSVILHSHISRNAWKTDADLYIQSPVSDIGMLEWEKFDQARRAMEDIDLETWV